MPRPSLSAAAGLALEGAIEATHSRPAPRGLDPRRGPEPPALAGGERDSKGGGESERLLLWRLFGDFLAGQKVTRGPGPGRPRRLQVCTNLRPGPAGPDKKAPALCPLKKLLQLIFTDPDFHRPPPRRVPRTSVLAAGQNLGAGRIHSARSFFKSGPPWEAGENLRIMPA